MKNLRKITRHFYLRQIVASVLVSIMLLGMPVQVALANPNPTPGALPYGVLSGTSPGVGVNTAGFTMNVNSNPGQTVINWRNFDIGVGSTVNFNQSSGWVLNQVYPEYGDGMATGINGHLNALNCGVIVTNPRGMVFGPTAFVDAQSFIASSLRMNKGKFLNGQFEFSSTLGYGNGITSVMPGARINAQNLAALLGKKVLNMGTISAGSDGFGVAMGAGDKIVLTAPGGKIHVQPYIWTNPLNRVVDNGGFGGTGSGIIDAPGADVVLAAGDIYSTAIEGVESLTAVSHKNVYLNGDISATGSVKVNASTYGQRGNVYVNGNMTASDIKIKAGDTTKYEASMDRIVLADGKTMTSTLGNIDLQAVHDIILGGPVSSAQDLYINADRQGKPDVHQYGGDLWPKDTLTANRDILIWANGIDLDADVTAIGRDLLIWGRSSSDNPDGGIWRNMDVASGVTLKAGDDLRIRNSHPGSGIMTVTGHDSMSLIAGDEITTSSNVSIGVLGSTLLMQAGASLDTADYMFFNQANTDLTLISTGGSVTSNSGANAANKWDSIGVHAYGDIILARSNGKKEITLGDSGTEGKSLLSDLGYIEIAGFNIENADENADWDVEAHGSVFMNVYHGINLGGDVTAHNGDIVLRADTDERYGHDVVVRGTITSGGKLELEGSNIDIHDAHSEGNMDIFAHGLYGTDNAPDEPLIGSGDVRVRGELTTTDGHIQITATDFGPGGATVGPTFASPGNQPYSATGTIYLHDDVTANGSDNGDDVRLFSNTVAHDDITIKAHDDVYLKNDKNIKGKGDLYIVAGDNIELGAFDETNPSNGGSGGEVTTNGNLKMTAGDDVYAYGKLKTKGTAGTIGDGDLTVRAQDDIRLYDTPVSADAAGELKLIADSDNSANGDLVVDGSLYGNMLLEGHNVTVSGDVISHGNLRVNADRDIRLKRKVESADNMIMRAGDDIRLNQDNGNTVSGGEIKLLAGLDASHGDVEVTGKLRTTNAANGDITVRATDDIRLKNKPTSADAAGELKLIADSDDNQDGDLTVDGSLHGNMTLSGYFVTVSGNVDSTATLDVDADRDITLKKTVKSFGDMKMVAGDDITLNENSGKTESLNGNITLTAGPDDTSITSSGTAVIETGTLKALNGKVKAVGERIKVNGNVKADSVKLKTIDDFQPGGVDSDIYVTGNVEAAQQIEINSHDSVKVDGKIKSDNSFIEVLANTDNLRKGEIEIGGKVTTLDTADGDITIKILPNNTSNPAGADGDIMLHDNVDSAKSLTVVAQQGDVLADKNLDSRTEMLLKSVDGSVIVDGKVTSGSTLDGRAGVDIIIRKNVESADDMTMLAGNDIELNDYSGNTTSGGRIRLIAGITNNRGDVYVEGKLETTDSSNGDITVIAPDEVWLDDDVLARGHFRALAGQASSIGESSTLAVEGDITAESIAMRSGNGDVDGYYRDNIVVWGDIESKSGDTRIVADDHVTIYGDVTSDARLRIIGNKDKEDGGIVGNVKVYGDMESNHNTVVKGRNIYVDGDVTSGRNVRMHADDRAYNGIDGDVEVTGITKAERNIRMTATDDITLGGSSWGPFGYTSALAGRNITLLADRGSYAYPYGGDVTAYGNLFAGHDITIDAADNTIYLWGNTGSLNGDIHFMTNVKFKGWDDQYVFAKNGSITADGYLSKLNYRRCRWSDGSLYLRANGDISLADYVRAAICYPEKCFSAGGGVSIISKNGAIFTPGYYVDGKRALAIDITGRSDQFGGRGPVGVRLPYGDCKSRGRAAIVLQSKEDLMLHENSDLLACGRYYSDGSVDDRFGVGFLAEPANIGGHNRNQGDPFDAAIYVGSTKGNVHMGGEVDIYSREFMPYEIKDGQQFEGDCIPGEWVCRRNGALIVDAYDTVSFGSEFIDALESGRVGNRTEVASRITEWLEDAVGRLPFPSDIDLPEGYNYVMRGAGLENDSITDGRAWVLENRPGDTPPAPLAREIGEPLEKPEFAKGGCPALMQWFASEIGLPEDQINVMLGNADHLATDIQPCEACARLKEQADAMAELDTAQVEVWANAVTAGFAGPMTPETLAGIQTALADNPAALSFDNAAAEYVRILSEELGLEAAEAASVLTRNYTDGQADLDAYVAARAAAL